MANGSPSCNHFEKFPFLSSPLLLHVWKLIGIYVTEGGPSMEEARSDVREEESRGLGG